MSARAHQFVEQLCEEFRAVLVDEFRQSDRDAGYLIDACYEQAEAVCDVPPPTRVVRGTAGTERA